MKPQIVDKIANWIGIEVPKELPTTPEAVIAVFILTDTCLITLADDEKVAMALKRLKRKKQR